jgi:NitT/TauT family transport system permease protein
MAVRHYHHYYQFSYLTSKKKHFGAVFIVIFLLIAIFTGLFKYIIPEKSLNFNHFSLAIILIATYNTLFRLLVSYFFALLLAIPISLLITKTPKIEKFLLPIADVIQSIPVLAFFPVLVLAFIKLNELEGAVLSILFMEMLWYLVFSMIGGLKTIPKDILDAATVFKIKGFNKLRFIIIPAIFPYIITGSLLAWAAGWSILIVAESLHSYIPNGNPTNDPLGLGSLLVNSFSKGQTVVFLASLITMIIVIALINFFVWQKLLHIAERFKFD